MKVQEVMSKPAIVCRRSDGLDTPARLMWEHDCGVIPVVDDGGKLVGMITDRDICMAAYTQGSALHTIRVSNAMARKVFLCGPGDSLAAVEQVMGEHKIRRLPVIDSDNRPIGVVSMNDIARKAATSRKPNAAEHDVVQTMAAICEPRPLAKAQTTALPAQAAV